MSLTRSLLKTFSITGGGLIATWLAVTPAATPPGLAPARVERVRSTPDFAPADLISREAKLRERGAGAPLQPLARNPFKFASTGGRLRRFGAGQWRAAAPAGPNYTLSGIAERKTEDGAVRTAIIADGTQVFLVNEGDFLPGRFGVLKVGADAVELLEPDGTRLRLLLR